MRRRTRFSAAAAITFALYAAGSHAGESASPPLQHIVFTDVADQLHPDTINPAIDMTGYLQIAYEAALHRESRRLSEEEFLRMSRESGTIVLDARSAEKYMLLHVKGAINLSFPDITIDSLAAQLPDKDVRILIYCNNNFADAPLPFPSKSPNASLNLSTYIALYSYGYRNVYELGPLLNLTNSQLEFVSNAPLAQR